jgi:hypothetical protein
MLGVGKHGRLMRNLIKKNGPKYAVEAASTAALCIHARWHCSWGYAWRRRASVTTPRIIHAVSMENDASVMLAREN